MKYALFFLPLLLMATLTAQTATITVKTNGCSAMNLYAFNGAGFETVAPFVKGEAGTFTVEVPAGEAAFRYVGSRTNDALPVIVGADEALTITGTCGQMQRATVADSPINARYRELKQSFQDERGQRANVIRAWQAASKSGDTTAVNAQLAELRKMDEAKKALLQSTTKAYPLLGRVVSLNSYLNFLTDNSNRYGGELDYFVNTYFQFVDPQDEGYGDLPWTYEGNRNFAQTLAGAIKNEQLGPILQAVYNRWPAGSRAKLFAMSGGFASLMQRKHPSALSVATAISEEFKDKFPAPVKLIEAQSASLRTLAVGAEAPVFTAETPAGDQINLKDLRGKVVLLDFWASWCGPCRRENPNVVRMYNKYKDQGFEILAVSLDKTRDRWVKAIADDGLTWLHVSDLKGWKSEYGRLYGVSSIPQTVLLDAEGRIIARNLRGAALEKKVGEVLK